MNPAQLNNDAYKLIEVKNCMLEQLKEDQELREILNNYLDGNFEPSIHLRECLKMVDAISRLEGVILSTNCFINYLKREDLPVDI